jgi:hypothetical protein
MRASTKGNKNEILKKIYHFMYDDATLFLTRKKEKMEQIIANREAFAKKKGVGKGVK